MLRDLVLETHPGCVIRGPFATVQQGVDAIRRFRPKLVFLDVELADGSGFDVLNEVSPSDLEVIITSAYETYALQAIKHRVLDYLVKPCRKSELVAALAKTDLLRTNGAARRTPVGEVAFQKLAVPTSAGFLFLTTGEIIRLQSERNYTDFILSGNRKVVVTRSLKEYEDLLAPLGFFRVHHSHIVNLNHVTRYIRGEGGYLVLSDGSNVDVSRRRKEDFLSLLPGV